MPSQLFQAIIYIYIYIYLRNSLGASTQTLWMWSPPSRPTQLITSRLFFFTIYISVVVHCCHRKEGRAFVNVQFAGRSNTLSEALRADLLMLNHEQ